jgi:coenzyme F420-reducing hydrogenase delta subunit
MFNMSAAMAGEFAAAAKTMTEQISALGPNPLRTSIDAERGE